MEVSEAVDDPGGAEKGQDAKAAGGGHVSPHTVSQLDHRAEAHCREHLWETHNIAGLNSIWM